VPTIGTGRRKQFHPSCLCVRDRGRDAAAPAGASRCASAQSLVEGAVGMLELALEMLSSKRLVELDVDRRAALVSNLMVVLCSERDTQPIVNAGPALP